MSVADDLLKRIRGEQAFVLTAIDSRDLAHKATIRQFMVSDEFMQDYTAVLAMTTADPETRSALKELKAARSSFLNASLDCFVRFADQLFDHAQPVSDQANNAVNSAMVHLGNSIASFLESCTAGKLLDPCDSWPTVSDTARMLERNKGVISKMVGSGELKDNGKSGSERRINPVSICEYAIRTGAKIESSRNE